MSEELKKKLEQLKDLIKALGTAIPTSLRMPGSDLAKPKKPSMAPTLQKDPNKIAAQIKDPVARNYAKTQAKMQTKALSPLAMKSEDGNLFYALKDGHRLNDEPMSEKELKEKFGNNIELARSKPERLSVLPNGQWKID